MKGKLKTKAINSEQYLGISVGKMGKKEYVDIFRLEGDPSGLREGEIRLTWTQMRKVIENFEKIINLIEQENGKNK